MTCDHQPETSRGIWMLGGDFVDGVWLSVLVGRIGSAGVGGILGCSWPIDG
jgi:hypothetical protein